MAKRHKNPYRNPTYLRAVPVSTRHLTGAKQARIARLIRNFRLAVNGYIRIIYAGCLNIADKDATGEKLFALDAKTLARIPAGYCDLSERYKSQALKQALEVMASVDNKKSEQEYQAKHGKRKASRPVWNGHPTLDAKFIDIAPAEMITSFDRVATLSTLEAGQRMDIPFEEHKQLKRWLAKPGAKLRDACELHADKLILYVELPNEAYLPSTKGTKFNYKAFLAGMLRTGKVKPDEVWGLDLGINKVAVLTNTDEATPVTQAEALFEGLWQHAKLDKRLRKKRGSRAFRRASAEYENAIGELLNGLPWASMKILVVERLLHLKYHKTWKKLLLWLASVILERLAHKALEHRVYLVKGNPRNTSKTCPACRTVEKRNRKGETYRCACNGIILDADFVGAYNIRRRFLEQSAEYGYRHEIWHSVAGLE